MPRFFDPDRRIVSRDKLFHAVGGFFVFVALNLVTAPLTAFVFTLLLGATFELGQWDASRGTAQAGQAGYGFGLLDLAADLVGALFALVLMAPVAHPTLVVIDKPASADSAWTYVQACFGLKPKPGHGLADVAWAKDSLVLYTHAENQVMLATWIPRDRWPDGPGPDTIVLDVWHLNVPRIIAHELLHQLIAINDTNDPHPDVPFVYPCNLMFRRNASR